MGGEYAGLTWQQERVVTFIGRWVRQYDVRPTVADIANWVGTSREVVYRELEILEEKGFLLDGGGWI